MKRIKKENSQKLDMEFCALKYYSDKKSEVLVIELTNGQKIDLHTTNFKALFYVLDGEGYLLSSEEKIRVQKSDLIVFEIEDQRGWEAPENGFLKLLVTKIFK